MSTQRNDPTEKEKRDLLNILNTMNKENHMYIFINFLENTKVYTITNDATLFDLNDLEKDTFWKIYDYSILYNQDKIKNNKIKELEIEHNDILKQLEQSLVYDNIIKNQQFKYFST